MVLRLIGDEETTAVEFGGTTFTVRVRSGTWWDDLRTKHATGGEFDSAGFRAELMPMIVEGWDAIHDAAGGDIPYAPEMTLTVFAALPEDCQDAIMRAARGRHRAYSEALGN
jgi:hypothetical protein